jgi:hypothetical protein
MHQNYHFIVMLSQVLPDDGVGAPKHVGASD